MISQIWTPERGSEKREEKDKGMKGEERREVLQTRMKRHEEINQKEASGKGEIKSVIAGESE